MDERGSLADIIGDLTWEQITEDGIITLEEVEAILRAKGIDPYEGYDLIYG